MKKSQNNLEADHILSLSNYISMVNKFKEAGYQFINFKESIKQVDPYVILRHDEDFSLRSSLKLAEVEHELGVKSSYFFLFRSPLYNLFSENAYQILALLSDWGNDICLHFDLSLYGERYYDGLSREIELFTRTYPFCNSNIISFHRVGSGARKLNSLILPPGMMHTYEDRFFTEIKYFSDSGGKWKSEVPNLSSEFNSRRSMQSLTHPMWWTQDGANEFDKLRDFLSTNREETIDLLEKTVISYSLSTIRN